jgi:hypothetical protein
MKAEIYESPVTSSPRINLLGLFRMPWSMSDNAFSWLEPTRFCDLDCEYCYQIHDPGSHKTLDELEKEVRGLLNLRRTDVVLIAGGEPLTHPNIIEIVRMVSSLAAKTLILTNGNRLTPVLAHRLKLAELKGFIFHVDSRQNRPGWKGKSERELNGLRQNLADMVYEERGMFCGFDATIVPSTLSEMPEIVKWTAANIHKVHLSLLIPVRVPHRDDPYEYFAGGERVALEGLPFIREEYPWNMTAMDLNGEILKILPGFRFNSYLGGTLRSDVPKWLFGNIIGTPATVIGNMGSRSMELLQGFHHLATGRYLSFLSPWLYRTAQLLFPLAPFDDELRRTLRRYIGDCARNPSRWFRSLHIQTIVVMQPLDVLENGEQDLCDGCPNKTMWHGRLVSECRMEEHLRFGRCLTMARKKTESSEVAGRID